MTHRKILARPAGLVFGALALVAAAAPQPRVDRATLLSDWGRTLADEAGVTGAELSDAELGEFLHGAEVQLGGQPAGVDLRRAAGDLDRLQAARLARVTRARQARAEVAANAFFRSLATDPHVRTLPDGLAFTILSAGDGAPPRPGQTVTLQYTGRTIAGAEFVRMDPHDRVLVPNRVPPALFEGVRQIAPHGRIRLFVPPKLLAADAARLGIAPGVAAVFDVDVLAIRETPPDDLADALLPAAPDPEPPPPSGYDATQLMTAWGWTVARQAHAVGIPLDVQDIAAFIRGLRTGVRSDEPVALSNEEQHAWRTFAAAERTKAAEARRRRQAAANDAFFAAVRKRPGVVAQPDGLCYEVLAPGRPPHPRPHDVTVVSYTGELLDGTVFDRTDNEPLHVEVGAVIEGWNEGIQKIGAGGRIRLYVPAALGYGDEDVSGVLTRIPANSTLIYTITLLRVEPAGAATAP